MPADNVAGNTWSDATVADVLVSVKLADVATPETEALIRKEAGSAIGVDANACIPLARW